MIRVFLVDDHRVVRHGLRQLIEAAGDMVVTGEAASGHAVVDGLTEHPSDVLVLDLSLPRVSGMEALRRVRVAHPDVRVVVFSMYAEAQHATRLLGSGASAYVGKDRDPAEVLQAIRAAMAGVPITAPEPVAGPSEPHERLTPREYQVFFLLLEGRAVTEIAAELDLHASTVSNLVRSVKEKLASPTTTALLQYARRVGLID